MLRKRRCRSVEILKEVRSSRLMDAPALGRRCEPMPIWKSASTLEFEASSPNHLSRYHLAFNLHLVTLISSRNNLPTWRFARQDWNSRGHIMAPRPNKRLPKQDKHGGQQKVLSMSLCLAVPDEHPCSLGEYPHVLEHTQSV